MANCRIKWKSQIHKRKCLETILAVSRGRQVRFGKCHPNEGPVLLCHSSNGQYRRLGRRKLGRIQIRSTHVDKYEINDMQWAEPFADFFGSSNSDPLWKP